MKNLLFITFLTLVFLSCKKQIDELPEPTTTGANTFGARINGELWGPMKFGIAATAPILQASFAGNNSFRINARNFAASPNESEMEIFLKDVTAPGVYQLNRKTGIQPGADASYGFYIERNLMPKNEWITNTEYTGTVTITRLDIQERIIAGTFEFRAINMYNEPSPIHVTDGRFDLKIQ